MQRIRTPGSAAAVPCERVALEDLYQQYSRYVASIGLRLLGRDSEIEDLVQDVFVEAATSLQRLRDPNATRAWLATLSVRVARRRIRRRRLRSFIVGGKAAEYSVLVDPGASPQERLLLTRCYEALDTLPANQRLAWVLRNIEGEPLDVVAQRCECSLATAKRHLQRAQAHLQKVVCDG